MHTRIIHTCKIYSYKKKQTILLEKNHHVLGSFESVYDAVLIFSLILVVRGSSFHIAHDRDLLSR